jgi:protein-S-isoprenylcysteine O-methyltransferase Ste14
VWRLLRHAFAILVLPFSVVVLIPLWIADRYGLAPAVPERAAGWLVAVAGVVVLAAGASLAALCIARFFTEGRGTLAPWDPPVELVVRGPYAHVRNPMISGVVIVLIGEAMVLRSLPHALWAATFAAINAVYLPLVEEPMLRARFGESYATYARNVPRLIPRLRPWQPQR